MHDTYLKFKLIAEKFGKLKELRHFLRVLVAE